MGIKGHIFSWYKKAQLQPHSRLGTPPFQANDLTGSLIDIGKMEIQVHKAQWASWTRRKAKNKSTKLKKVLKTYYEKQKASTQQFNCTVKGTEKSNLSSATVGSGMCHLQKENTLKNEELNHCNAQNIYHLARIWQKYSNSLLKRMVKVQEIDGWVQVRATSPRRSQSDSALRKKAK